MAPHDGGGSTNSTSEIDELLPEAQTHRRYTQSTKRGPTRQRKNSYSALGRQRFGRKYHSLIAFSTIIYWTSVSLIPVYNKHFFQKSLYPYPVATAGIQLGVVSILLAVLNIVQHIVSSNRNTYNSSGSLVIASRGKSWIFGPHFLWKIKWCFPIGCLFGLKYGITNLGLDLVPAPTHLLLQSTDLVWTVLGAYIINAEVVSTIELICLAGCVAGSVVLGWSIKDDSSLAAPLFAILVNLTSPIFLGLCLATLRLACIELMRPDNRVGGTVSSVELTSIKLIVSSFVALILACILEKGDETKDSWWIAFIELEQLTRLGVIVGAFLIAVFQVNCTFLTFLSSTVTVGLVGQVKIIPQWILATITVSRTSDFKVKELNMIGAFLIMMSAAAFAIYNYIESSPSPSDVACRDEENGDDDCSISSEGKPLLLLRDADDWGAAFMRKSYDSIQEEKIEEITGYANPVVEHNVPFLNATGINIKNTSHN